MFEFTIEILDNVPGEHSVLVMVVDQISRVAADSIRFTTPELPRATCGVRRNVLTCDSNNPIDTQLCQFDSDAPMPCTSPLNVLALGLPLGPHSLLIVITDVFGRTLEVPVAFLVVSNLQLTCVAIEGDREYIGRVDCRSSTGIGEVSYECSYDGGPPENCEWKQPRSSVTKNHCGWSSICRCRKFSNCVQLL